MSLHLLFALLAIACFVAAVAGLGNGRAQPLGLLFLTIALVLT